MAKVTLRLVAQLHGRPPHVQPLPRPVRLSQQFKLASEKNTIFSLLYNTVFFQNNQSGTDQEGEMCVIIRFVSDKVDGKSYRQV